MLSKAGGTKLTWNEQLEYYMDIWGKELDDLADLESSMPSNDAKPEFDQSLLKAIEQEGEPEPTDSLVSLSWPS